MKKWKKTAIFVAFAVFVCASVQAWSPEELLLEAVQAMDLDNLNYALRQGNGDYVNYMDSKDKTVLSL